MLWTSQHVEVHLHFNVKSTTAAAKRGLVIDTDALKPAVSKVTLGIQKKRKEEEVSC